MQEQHGLYTTIEESISVQQLQRRFRHKVVTHPVIFQPDLCLSLLQLVHPIHRSLSDPLLTPLISKVDHAPGNPTTLLSNSPSKTTEQFLYGDCVDGVSVASLW
ncbi:hypothetical protein SLE2022_265120 [Rubroshorea leprosula]